MAYIFINKPDGSKNKYRLPNNESTRVDIGRGDDCLISLPDVLGISGLHCSIGFSNGYYFIKDENSSNGTIVDGRAITQEPLYEEKSYHIGEAILTFFGEGVVAPPPAAPAKSNFASEDGKIKISGNADGPSRKYASTAKAKLSDRLFPLYVVIVCIVSLLAGITLRHWKETGEYNPTPFTKQASAAPVANKAAKATEPKKEAPAQKEAAAPVKEEAAPAEEAPAANAEPVEELDTAEEEAPAEELDMTESDESIESDDETDDEGSL